MKVKSLQLIQKLTNQILASQTHIYNLVIYIIGLIMAVLTCLRGKTIKTVYIYF